MSVVHAALHRLRTLAFGRAWQRELDDEMRHHVELEAQQLVARGIPPRDALLAARRRFGNATYLREETRHMAGLDRLDTLRQDLRISLRGLRREPLFTTFVVITLALGIGANAATFGVVDALMLRGPAQVRAPHEMVRLFLTARPAGMREYTTDGFGYVTYGLMRHARTLAGVTAYASNDVILGRGLDAQSVPVQYATSDFFSVLGVSPVAGRFYTSAEDSTSGAAHVAVISYGLWQRMFAGSRDAIGKSLVVRDVPYTVVGVAPKGFTGPEMRRVDAWLPMTLYGSGITGNWTTAWDAQWLKVIARLAPGVTREQAAAEVTTIHRRAYTGDEKDIAAATFIVGPLGADESGHDRTEVTVSRWLMAVSLLVLLLACANIINLLLARGMKRGREVAVRLALGADRARLVRLLLTESLLLAAIGGAAGVSLAYALGSAVRHLLVPEMEWTSSPVDARVLILSMLVSLVVGVVVGLVPALRSSRPNLTSALRSGVREGGDRRSQLRRGLVVLQGAVTVLLLVGAGLMMRSLSQARSVDLGIAADHVLAIDATWPSLRSYPSEAAREPERARREAVLVAAVDQLRRLPGVEGTVLTIGLPFGNRFRTQLRIPGRDSLPQVLGGAPNVSAAGPGYFGTVGTPILRGRGFTASDRAGSEPVTVVSALMAKVMWPGEDALGQCLIIGKQATTCSRVIGVSADTHREGLREEPSMHYYQPYGQQAGYGGTQLLVRFSGDEGAVVARVRRALVSADPSILFVNAETVQHAVDPQLRPWNLGARIFGYCGLLALLVAAVGIFSVMSYLVAQRTHEIGVRVALGAGARDIMRFVMRESLAMSLLGVVIGLLASLWAGRFIEPMLFDTSPRDPYVLGLVAGAMVVVSVLATALPVRRANRVNAMEALREA